MQYITFLLLAISVAVVHAEEKDKCFRFHHSIPKGCCKIHKKPPSDVKELWKQCHKESSDKPCAVETCFGTKRGFLTEDGTIDNDKFVAGIEEHIDNKELVDTIKEKCIDQDLAAYGPKDMCPVKKLIHCVVITVFNSCPEWREDDACQKMKTDFEECSKKIP